MELDPVHERVFVDRSRVRGPAAQRLAVGLAGAPHVGLADHPERDELDGVDLDQADSHAIPTTLLDLWPLPEPDGHRDVAGQDVVAQLAAELHGRDATGRFEDPRPLGVLRASRVARKSSKAWWVRALSPVASRSMSRPRMTASTTVASSGRPRLPIPSSSGSSQSVVAVRRKPGHKAPPAVSYRRPNMRRYGSLCGPEIADQARARVVVYGSSARR